jgi:hypothetical protein
MRRRMNRKTTDVQLKKDKNGDGASIAHITTTVLGVIDAFGVSFGTFKERLFRCKTTALGSNGAGSCDSHAPGTRFIVRIMET